MKIPKALVKELELPVTYTDKGKLVTLRDFVANKDNNSHLPLSSLNLTQRAKIIAERLKQEPEVELATIGTGVINKERAIAEVEAQSPVGQVLIESEQYAIKRLIEEIKNGRLKKFINNSHDSESQSH